MEFGQRLESLRKSRNMSVDDLAYKLDISSWNVEDWEKGAAVPDLNELNKIAGVFNMSAAQLLDDGSSQGQSGYMYEYKSRAELFGLPLVHIKSGGNSGRIGVAKGIIAIGDIAVGVLAMGGIALGGISLGGISAGLVLAIGGMSLGGFALGGLAVGYMALGGLAIGINAIGGAAIASDIAMGGYAKGTVAIGDEAVGKAVFSMYSVTKESFRSAVNEYLPNAWDFVVRLFEGVLGL
jgi:transcriptional regulator with XRE-family HTH domain